MELQAQGKFDEAEPLYREALEAQRGTLGDRNPDTLSSINNLSALLQAKGDLAADGRCTARHWRCDARRLAVDISAAERQGLPRR